MTDNIEQKIYFADLESTGLLHHLVEQGDKAKLHNFCAMSVDGKNMWTFHTDTDGERKTLQRFLDRDIILVMHNGIQYDKSALEFFGYNLDKVIIVDTLALSWALSQSDMIRHGLEEYGILAGVPKPKVSDWENLTQADYDHRVQEDVKIQQFTYQRLKSRLEELDGKMSDYEFCTHQFVRYLNFKMTQLAEQQNTRFKVDVKHAKAVIEKLEKEIEYKTNRLISVMPKVPVYTTHKRPSNPFKKDGSLSVAGEKWKQLCWDNGVKFDYTGDLKSTKGHKEPNPSSSQQIKDWLFSLGWEPLANEYKYVKDGNGDRKIPQIYKQGSGGQVNESIQQLAEEHKELENLVGLGVLTHRKSCVQGFLDSLMLDDVCEAGASGFTNTLRLKHRKPVVNLPSTRVLYGEDVRACIIARDGKKFVCSDLSAMENIWGHNYQLPFDPEYIMSQQAPDHDPHLAIALEGKMLTQDDVSFYKIVEKGFPKENYTMTEHLMKMLELNEGDRKKEIKRISKIRAIGKSTNYGCAYNAGALTISRNAGVSEKIAKNLVNAYREKNWAIKAVAESMKIKKTSHGTYQYNPTNGFWYYMKNEKDAYNLLVQGSGSYLLDLWLLCIFHLRDKDGYKVEGGMKLLCQMHDECLFEFNDSKENEGKVFKLLQDALDLANDKINMQLKFGCDTQFGYKYSEIH